MTPTVSHWDSHKSERKSVHSIDTYWSCLIGRCEHIGPDLLHEIYTVPSESPNRIRDYPKRFFRQRKP